MSVRCLPPASFRSRLAADTLAFGCILPTIRAVWGLAPFSVCSCRTNMNKSRQRRGWREGSHIDSIASCPRGRDKFMDERDESWAPVHGIRCLCLDSLKRSRCCRLLCYPRWANSTSSNPCRRQRWDRNPSGDRRQAGRWRCRSGRPPDGRLLRPVWFWSRCSIFEVPWIHQGSACATASRAAGWRRRRPRRERSCCRRWSCLRSHTRCPRSCRRRLLYSVLASLASICLACCRIVSWFRSSFVMSCRWVHWWFKGCSFIIIFRPAYSLSLSTDWFLSDLVIIIRAIIRKDKGKSKKNNHFGQKIYPIGHFASAPAAPIGHFMLATCW